MTDISVACSLAAPPGLIGLPVTSPPTPARLETIIIPAVSVIYDGQAISDMPGYADMIAPANFTSNKGTISDVSVTFTGDATNATAPLAEDAVAGFRINVTDSAGNSAVFDAGTTIVDFAVRVISAVGNEALIERNPMATSGLYPLDMSGSDAPYNGTYMLDLAEYITRPVILATVPVSGDAAVGEVLNAIPALAASEGVNGVETRAYQWYRFRTNTENIGDRVPIQGAVAASYTAEAADEGYTLLRGEVVSDSLGTSREALNTGIDIPASAVIYTDTFVGPDNTPLPAHQTDTGQNWINVGVGTTPPLLDAGRLFPNKSSGGSEFYALDGVSLTDCEVAADILTGTFGAGLGLIARVQGTGSSRNSYYARLNKAQNRIQLYRVVNGNTTSLGSAIPDPAEDNASYRLVLRCVGSTIEVDWNGSTVISATSTHITGPGSVGIGHYRANTIRWDNFSAGAI